MGVKTKKILQYAIFLCQEIDSYDEKDEFTNWFIKMPLDKILTKMRRV